jgi:undecaprenyl diphosphate synthase
MAAPGKSGRTDERMQREPRHIAIIMDGNGRWAAQRGLPRAEGHRRGVEAVRATVQAAIELGVPYLTIFSFSSENWTRPASEISDLLNLMKRYIRRDLATLHKHNVRIRVIGERSDDAEIRGMIEEAESLTAANTGLNLVVAFNYGSRAEIVGAARRLAEQVQAGTLTTDAITPERFARELHTVGLPDPDLLIRTSGEHRLSNFLLWQLAYAEFVFVDAYWPDFTKEHLAAAIEDFRRRDRRYGGLSRTG